MSMFGVELNAQMNRLLIEIKLTLQKQKLLPNLRTIYRSFAKYDPEITGTVTLGQFEKALSQNGIFFKQFEYQIFNKAYSDGSGKIVWFTLLQHLKEPLNSKRKDLVSSIYDHLSSKGQLNIQSIVANFNPNQIEIFKNGKVSSQYLFEQLISLLPMPQNQVSKEEFIAFHEDLNVNYPHDEPFLKYISIMWNFVSQNQSEVKEEELRATIKALRYKLIQKTKGTNDEFLLKKLFNEYDQNRNGYISEVELDLLLKKLELVIPENQVEPLLRKLDKNNSGYIQYDEFKRFIFFDPFPA